ncbi:MAG: protease modulator HflC [Acetobacteraceae bacterium]
MVRVAAAGVILAAAALSAATVVVAAGQAMVITQFGDPIRVVTRPGLAWKWPAPIQSAIAVDTMVHTTSTGMADVGTRDGLRVLVEAYVVWEVPRDADAVRLFLQAVRNDTDEAARQLRSLVGSALQVSASGFELADLVNTDRGRVRLTAFEERLRSQIEAPLRTTYGIKLRAVGIERLSLPEPTLVATVNRMRAERETVAAARTAEGTRQAAEIQANSMRDGRLMQAEARIEAAEIEATARREAAAIYAKAYAGDPQLYLTIRSLDALTAVVNGNTRILLRTDALPFSALIAPPSPGAEPAAVARPQ